MKRYAAFLFVLVTAVAILAWAESRERAQRFLIHVSWNGERVVLTCEKGCAWQDLDWSCDGQVPCKSWIDENGMTEKNAE